MKNNQPGSIENHFSNITDPRDLNKRHKFIDIITIAICVVVCGANSWEHIEVFGQSKLGWFKDSYSYPTVSPFTIHLVVFLPKLIRVNFNNHL